MRYELWYRAGVEIHDLRAVQNIQVKTRLAQYMIRTAETEKEARRAAEYILEMVKFDTENYKRVRIQNGKWNADVDALLDDEIRRVHKACSEEIRAKWSKPMMTDDDFGDYLYKHELGPILADTFPEAQKAQAFGLFL